MVVFSLLPSIGIEAGAGKSFGLFGGGMAAGIIGTKMFSRDRREPVVVERIVEVEQRPVYVLQPVAQQPVVAGQTQEIQNLKSQIGNQDNRISDLRRQLRQERKKIQKGKDKPKEKPETRKQLDEDAFGGWDSEIEG